MYKCKLNELCQKRGFESPNYSYIKYGQDHNPLYKPQVIVNGSIFKSSNAFKNHKSADDDVAEIACSHFITFSLPIDDDDDDDDVMKTSKKLKGSSSLSLMSNFNKGALTETGESSLPNLPKDLAAKVASYNHSALSITKTNSIKSITAKPDPFNLMGTYLLCNKIRVFSCIPDKTLTQSPKKWCVAFR